MNLCEKVGIREPLADDIRRAKQFSSLMRSSNARKVLNRRFGDKLIEIFPGFWSDDPRLPKILEELSRFKLESGSPSVFGLYTGPQCGPSLDRVRSRAGSTILPLSFSEKSEHLDYSEGLHEKVIKKVCDVVFSDRLEFYGRISKQSGTGFPYCEHDLAFKKHLLMKAMVHLKDIFRGVDSRDFQTLLEKYDCLFLSNTQIRRQTDAYNKRRDISLFESTRERPIRIKDVRPQNQTIEELRTRVVYAMSWVPNIIGTVFGHGYREFMDSEYEATFKHRGPKHVSEKIQSILDREGEEFFAVSLDYSRYDTSISFSMLKAFIESFPLPQQVKTMMELQLLAPHYCSDDGRGHALLDGDPLSSSGFKFFRGLPSGVWFTSSAGKVINVAFVITCLIQCGLLRSGIKRELTFRDIDDFLKHRHRELRVYLLNMGDDMVVMGNRTQVQKLIRQIQSSGIFEVQIEDGVTFLGYVYYLEKMKVKYQLSLASYVTGEFIPERSISDLNFRPYGALGLHLRESKEIYGSNVQFEDFKAFKNDVFKKYTSIDLDYLLKSSIRYPSLSQDMLSSSNDMSSSQRVMVNDIISDPSKVLWKYSEKDLATIRPIVEMFSQSIPPSIVEPYIKEFIHV